MIRKMTLTALLAAALVFTACSDDSSSTKDKGATTTDGGGADTGGTKADGATTPDTGKTGATRVKLVTSLGDVVLELDAVKAPKTTANFLAYVKSKHYDGTIFHRVISTFMIQGGGFDTSMSKKSTNSPIQNEADNGLSNMRGTIAMARTSAPHSATAQFFINVVDNKFLDHKSKTSTGWGYAVFGKVVSGLDTVDKIKAVKTETKGAYQNVPVTTVEIKSAAVVTK